MATRDVEAISVSLSRPSEKATSYLNIVSAKMSSDPINRRWILESWTWTLHDSATDLDITDRVDGDLKSGEFGRLEDMALDYLGYHHVAVLTSRGVSITPSDLILG